MARLRNSSGQIVIDEGEARADIRNIEQARAKLEEARRLLDPNKLDDARMLGAARDALDGLFVRACKDLDSWIRQCDETKNFINATVEKYQKIDRELAASTRR